MLSDPSAPGSTPMAVLVKDMDGIGEFNEKYRNVYKYEVLGSLHTMVAKQQLSEEYPENPFFKSVLADVYVGLSDEESLRLAQRHNTTSHFVHKVTHRDMVSTVMSKKIPFPNNITSHTINYKIVNNICIGWLVLYTW